MKRFVRFFVLLTAIVLTMSGCSVRKEQISPPSFSEKKERFTAFVNVNLIPMTEEKIIENQTVIVKDKRILEIGSSTEVVIPEKAQIIDGNE